MATGELFPVVRSLLLELSIEESPSGQINP